MTLQPGQFGQLKMFMSGKEIKDVASPGDHPGGHEDDANWEFKRGEALTVSAGEYGTNKHHSLATSIRESGVQRPVDLMHTQTGEKPLTLVQGHHRVAYQASVDPDRLIPVVHHEEPDLSKTKPEFHGLKRAKAVIPPARAFGWILGHDDDD